MKKLLIIEDNWMMAHMIEDVAMILKIEVVGIADSWDETEKLLTLNKPNFAIVDININGAIDGIKIARRLKEMGIVFLFLTAYKDMDTIKEAAELSPFSYLIKPITPENLMATFLLIIKKLEEAPEFPFICEYIVDNDDILYKNMALNLSKNERRVLGLLIKNISHTVEYKHFFSYEEENNERSLRNIVVKLRKKCPGLIIKNIKDVGYIASLTK
ncbi:MAG: response regulator [Sulfuricurvum sp.]|uniref:response regulator n=1 Tax=Sulfuricurvum sp. TaxID=2025608 RepID=UPI00263019E6|nr:response regulator [Sulfuricurvum sp.]MDD2368621.1 response regulator [Sulfuricurvum sp.]MDD5118834.1 response regulator [Sulfuricurvum sp.]